MRSVAFAFLLATTVASPALAQERAPFTGPRVEGVVGGDRVGIQNGHDDSILYGGAAGYDVQADRALIGIEGEYTDSDVRQCDGGLGTAASPKVCAKTGRDLYVGGRVGTVIGGSTLLYAKAGYTNAQAKATSNNGTATTTLAKDELDGVRLGVGAEHRLGGNTYVKAEYRYSNYEAGVDRNQLLAGFGLRF